MSGIISETELQDLSREELEGLVRDLADVVDDVDSKVDLYSDSVDDLESGVYGDYGYAMGSSKLERDGAILERLEDVESHVDDMQSSFAQLVADVPNTTKSNRIKLYSVVTRALEEGRQWSGGSTVGKFEAAGAADCSDRHALNLFDTLEEKFEWAEKDTSKEPSRLLIHTEEWSEDAIRNEVTKAFPELSQE